jgi:hypothetical protein
MTRMGGGLLMGRLGLRRIVSRGRHDAPLLQVREEAQSATRPAIVRELAVEAPARVGVS